MVDDRHDRHQVSPWDPPTRWAAITPDDTEDLTVLPTCIRCSADANITVRGYDENNAETDVTMYFLGGVWHAIRPRRILSTGTDGGVTIWAGWS